MVDSQHTDIDTVLVLVQRYARRFTHDPHDADDLAQITMIKAWLGWKPEMREWSDAQVSAWLYRTMQRSWIDTTRKQARRPHTEELTDIHYASDDATSHVERRELITVALSQLPEKQRVLLVMDAQGYTHKEIAERSHTTPKMVGDRLYQARVAIRKVAA